MKFVLVVLAALGLTVAWQASVVADNHQQQRLIPAQHQAPGPAAIGKRHS
jgi:hypothetical protein